MAKLNPQTFIDEVAYNPKNVYVTEDTLVDVDVGSRLDVYGDFYVNGQKLPTSGAIDVRSFGAVGDGITNDTVAIQNALNAAAALNVPVTVKLAGNHLITDHLYPFGAVSIEDGKLTLAGTTSHGSYWINCGIKDYGATTGNGKISSWSGNIRNVTFVTTNTTQAVRLINVHNGADWSISHNVFDLTGSGTTAVGPIGCYNNANFCNPSSKQRGYISNNTIIAAQDSNGSEGIGIGNCSDIWIVDNYIYGVGDDVLGVHTSDRVVISGNHLSSIDGRIYLSGCRDLHVVNNYVTRIPTPLGATISGGSMIHCEIETASQPAPTRNVIANNIVRHAPTIVSATYGIRFRGGVHCSANNNTVIDTTGFGYGITWEQQDATALGWTNPDGTEVDLISRVRNLTVYNNRVDTSAVFTIQEVGTFSAVGVNSQGKPPGDYATAFGDRSVASGLKSFAYGNQSSATSTYTTAGGNASTATGPFAISIGDSNTASGDGAIALGKRAKAVLDGTFTFANGNIAAVGDAQTSVIVVKCRTTTATPVKLGLIALSGSGLLVIPDQTTWAFTASIVARRFDADNESAAFECQGVIDRNTGAATTALVAAVTPLVVARDTAAWTVAVTADTTNGALAITCTGEAAKTIGWVGRIELVEVTG